MDDWSALCFASKAKTRTSMLSLEQQLASIEAKLSVAHPAYEAATKEFHSVRRAVSKLETEAEGDSPPPYIRKFRSNKNGRRSKKYLLVDNPEMEEWEQKVEAFSKGSKKLEKKKIELVKSVNVLVPLLSVDAAVRKRRSVCEKVSFNSRCMLECFTMHLRRAATILEVVEMAAR